MPTAASSPGFELLDRAVAVWRKAQVLYEAPAWQGQPEARALAEQLAASHRECEAALASLLLDQNQLVVAYALLTLELMQSPVLQQLPQELLQRRSTITLVCGSIKNAMDVGGLARRLQKRSSGQPASPIA